MTDPTGVLLDELKRAEGAVRASGNPNFVAVPKQLHTMIRRALGLPRAPVLICFPDGRKRYA